MQNDLARIEAWVQASLTHNGALRDIFEQIRVLPRLTAHSAFPRFRVDSDPLVAILPPMQSNLDTIGVSAAPDQTRPLRRSAPPALTPDEYKRRRRERRIDRTARLESEVRAWAERHGCTLRVLNGGQHWLFQRPGFTAEWWPSSAKLALNRDYLRAVHTPHWPEVSHVLEKAFSDEGGANHRAHPFDHQPIPRST